jgi:hypothetical protein
MYVKYSGTVCKTTSTENKYSYQKSPKQTKTKKEKQTISVHSLKYKTYTLYIFPLIKDTTIPKEIMSNMNWADHCSSDDESDDGLHPARLASNHSAEQDLSNDLSYDPSDTGAALSVTAGDDDIELEKETIPYPPEIDMNNLPENFPTEAPYTAYVRNLSFYIKTEDEFASSVEELINKRYEGLKKAKVVRTRFGIDREKKRKSFGYVEFGTPEEVS